MRAGVKYPKTAETRSTSIHELPHISFQAILGCGGFLDGHIAELNDVAVIDGIAICRYRHAVPQREICQITGLRNARCVVSVKYEAWVLGIVGDEKFTFGRERRVDHGDDLYVRDAAERTLGSIRRYRQPHD